MHCFHVLFAFATCWLVDVITGHGRLIDPPARNSMWRYNFPNPPNYNDNELNCGGFSFQWSNDGKCGVCGDPFGKEQMHVYPGKYANNIISKTYKKGQVITVKVELTANHKGYFTFRIGDIGNPPITEEKLSHKLTVAGTAATRYYLPAGSMNEIFTVSLQLPMNLVCRQCVLRWKYTAGNNWGTGTGGAGAGHGNQETFINCADVSIVNGDGSVPMGPVPPMPPSQPKPAPNPVPAPNPNPAPAPKPPIPQPQGQNCRSAGAYAGQKTIDAWCQANCPAYCPVTHCICS